MNADDFHAHLDACEQCRNHPFNLRAEGERLLRESEPGKELRPTTDDVGCFWLYRPEWGWQPVIVAYASFIQAGDTFRHPITPDLIWGGKITPPSWTRQWRA